MSFRRRGTLLVRRRFGCHPSWKAASTMATLGGVAVSTNPAVLSSDEVQPACQPCERPTAVTTLGVYPSDSMSEAATPRRFRAEDDISARSSACRHVDTPFDAAHPGPAAGRHSANVEQCARVRRAIG